MREGRNGESFEKSDNESLLLISEYRQNRDERDRVNDEELNLFRDEKGYGTFANSIKRDEKGDIVIEGISKEGLHEGWGTLGKRLQRQAEYLQKRRDPQEKYDKLVMDSYRSNPQVKEIFDKAHALQERLRELKEREGEIWKEKQKLYLKGANINMLLEAVGSDKRVPEAFDFETEIEEVKKLDKKDEAVHLQKMAALSEFLQAFENLEITPEQSKDMAIDFAAIQTLVDNLGNTIRMHADESSQDKIWEAYLNIPVLARYKNVQVQYMPSYTAPEFSTHYTSLFITKNSGS